MEQAGRENSGTARRWKRGRRAEGKRKAEGGWRRRAQRGEGVGANVADRDEKPERAQRKPARAPIAALL